MSPSQSGLLERVLANLEAMPLGALYRAAIGYALIPSLAVLTGRTYAGWWLVPWFVLVLVGLRVLPAVLRRALKVSPQLSAVWLDRRMMAKRYDSYQWRKLLWFGIGLGAYLVRHGEPGAPDIALALFCVGCGIAGSAVFRLRTRAGHNRRRSATDGASHQPSRADT